MNNQEFLDIVAQSFAPVLPLISSGYFHTARGIIDGLTVENEELDEVRKWLIGALEEADETGDGQ